MPEERNIVIVEDDSFLQRLYELKFVEQGFSVKAAVDGEKGLALVRELLPLAVLLDLDIPKLGGLEVLKALKSDEATKGIPVIILTNSSTQDSVEQARNLGAADYLIKAHFLPSEVVAKVTACLR